jgi:hypothetical protein
LNYFSLILDEKQGLKIFGQNSKKSDIVIRERERINSSLGDQQEN